jgi:UDP-GlcNAc:undecaprenyl-phosphate GlcNAc-1-phosphate transferase
VTKTTALLVVACAFLPALVSIPVFRALAHRRRLVDDAGDDPLKIHAAPIPFVGGLGIVLGCAAALGVAAVAAPAPRLQLGLVFAAGAAVSALGFADDVSTVRPVVRFAIEAAAAALLAVGGLAVGLFASKLFGPGAVGLAAFGLFAVFYVVGAINAVNMQDGLDGLAGGVVFVSAIGFAVVAVEMRSPVVLVLALALAAALSAFLVYNFNPASVFMGDNGSYFLGLLVATMALAVTTSQGGWRGLAGGILLVGAPVFDAAFAIVRRLARGVSPLTGDRSHFYDLLAQRGLSTKAVALVCYTIQTALVASGVALLVR